jgi:hypothetical protein
MAATGTLLLPAININDCVIVSKLGNVSDVTSNVTACILGSRWLPWSP